MKDSFFRLIWSSFVKTLSPVIAVIGVGVSYIAWIITPDSKISVSILILLLTISVLIIITLTNAVITSYYAKHPNLPKVLRVLDNFTTDTDSTILCITEPSELFSYGSVVSFYVLEDDKFERMFGIGYVVNVQDNGYIQIELSEPAEGAGEVLKRFKNNDKNTLEKILIKPTVSKIFLERRA